MDELEYRVLFACVASVQAQIELQPLLAAALGVARERLFTTWYWRRCQQRGTIPGTGWRYFFHGTSCNLAHDDGRYLRWDFGPGGRPGTVNAFGVLEYVMSARAPWPVDRTLQDYLSASPPPYQHHSGDRSKMDPIWERLAARGAFAPSSPDVVSYLKQHKEIEPGRPINTREPDTAFSDLVADSSVAFRTCLTPAGYLMYIEHAKLLSTPPAVSTVPPAWPHVSHTPLRSVVPG